jgi:hypothetical protein
VSRSFRGWTSQTKLAAAAKNCSEERRSPEGRPSPTGSPFLDLAGQVEIIFF